MLIFSRTWIFLMIFAVLAVASPAFAATLSLSPASGAYINGDTVLVNIVLDTQGAAISGVDIHFLHYNPAVFSIEDADGNQPGVQITPGSLMPVTVGNIVDTSRGEIQFSQLTSGGTTYTGSGTLGTVRLRVIGSGSSSLSFDATLGNTADSNVASEGQDLLTSATGASYSLQGGASPGTGSQGGGGPGNTVPSPPASGGTSANTSPAPNASVNATCPQIPTLATDGRLCETFNSTCEVPRGWIMVTSCEPEVIIAAIAEQQKASDFSFYSLLLTIIALALVLIVVVWHFVMRSSDLLSGLRPSGTDDTGGSPPPPTGFSLAPDPELPEELFKYGDRPDVPMKQPKPPRALPTESAPPAKHTSVRPPAPPMEPMPRLPSDDASSSLERPSPSPRPAPPARELPPSRLDAAPLERPAPPEAETRLTPPSKPVVPPRQATSPSPSTPHPRPPLAVPHLPPVDAQPAAAPAFAEKPPVPKPAPSPLHRDATIFDLAPEEERLIRDRTEPVLSDDVFMHTPKPPPPKPPPVDLAASPKEEIPTDQAKKRKPDDPPGP